MRFVNYRLYENALGLNNNTSIQCKKERSELPDCGKIVKPFMKMDPTLHYLPIFHCEHQFYIVPTASFLYYHLYPAAWLASFF